MMNSTRRGSQLMAAPCFLFYFNNKLSYGIVNDAGCHFFLAFSLKCSLIAVELISMRTCIMFAAWIEDKVIGTWTGFVVYNNICAFCFPNEVNISRNHMSISVKMSEGSFVMALDGFAIARFEGVDEVFP